MSLEPEFLQNTTADTTINDGARQWVPVWLSTVTVYALLALILDSRAMY